VECALQDKYDHMQMIDRRSELASFNAIIDEVRDGQL
jgi:hypothetical protein